MAGPPSSRPASPVDALRTALGFATLVPSLAAGLSVLALTGDRRRAANTSISLFADLAAAAVGLDLRARGTRHLEAARPAVFVFNHQSQLDVLVVAELLRRDMGFVGKREIRRHPLVGPVAAFIGTVFVDRADRRQAIAALAPAVEALRRGHSLAIAPEGTRSRTGELLPFKKGAFHVAMQAGVPVVPLVIHDAWRAWPRGSVVAHPATVHVDVLAPVPTRDWKPGKLEEHVEAVRARFAAALAAGPAGKAG